MDPAVASLIAAPASCTALTHGCVGLSDVHVVLAVTSFMACDSFTLIGDVTFIAVFDDAAFAAGQHC